MDSSLDELARQLKQRLCHQHQVILTPDDPLLIALTANVLMVEDTMARAGGLQQAVLDEHRQQLATLTARWTSTASSAAAALPRQMADAASQAAKNATVSACKKAKVDMDAALLEHATKMQRIAFATSISTAVAVLAATATIVLR